MAGTGAAFAGYSACGPSAATGMPETGTAAHTMRFRHTARTARQRLRRSVLNCKRIAAELRGNERAVWRGLLRWIPPRPLRENLLLPARYKRKNPGRHQSSRAPMTASAANATSASRAEAASGLHRSSDCSFAAPVLRACSSAHRIPGAEGHRWLPPFVSFAYGLIRLGPYWFCREFCAPPEMDARSASQAVINLKPLLNLVLDAPAQALRIPNFNVYASDCTRPDVTIFYCTPRGRFGKTPRRTRMINKPEYHPEQEALGWRPSRALSCATCPGCRKLAAPRKLSLRELSNQRS